MGGNLARKKVAGLKEHQLKQRAALIIQTTYRRFIALRKLVVMKKLGAENAQVVANRHGDVTTEEGVSIMTENECGSIDEDKSGGEEIIEFVGARPALPEEPAGKAHPSPMGAETMAAQPKKEFMKPGNAKVTGKRSKTKIGFFGCFSAHAAS